MKSCSFSRYKEKFELSCCCWPVGSIVFRSAGNVLWLVCEFILLDFRLQIFGFGSARTWAWPVTTFAVQLLLLWLVARGGSRVWVFPQLQKALISLLVLPVCEDLRRSTERGNQQWRRCKRWHCWNMCLGFRDNWLGMKPQQVKPNFLLPVSAPPGLEGGGWPRTAASPAPAAGCPAPQCQFHRPLTGRAQQCSVGTPSRARRAWSRSISVGGSPSIRSWCCVAEAWCLDKLIQGQWTDGQCG